MKERPFISILIPSYEYSEGVKLILDFIKLSRFTDFECIISDDSYSDEVEKMARSHQLFKDGKILYTKNKPSLGAVSNWNNLINKAKSDYMIFMHHDECPVDLNFFDELQKLIRLKNPDIIFLRCFHYALLKSRIRFHMPVLLLRLFLWWPNLLLLHNVVGSPSNLVFHRSLSCQFNENFKWFVDVEWICQLMKENKNWVLSKKLRVLSYIGRQSITRDISNNLQEILHSEVKMFEMKDKFLPVCKLLNPKSFSQKIFSILHKFIWFVILIIINSASYLFSKPIPKWLKTLDA